MLRLGQNIIGVPHATYAQPVVEIQGKVLRNDDVFSPVTYVPSHVNGDASKGETGVLISWDETGVRVLYTKSRTIQRTDAKDLVWG